MRSTIQVLALSGMLTLGMGAGFAQAGSTDQAAPPAQGEGPGGGMRHRGPISPEEQLAHLTKSLSLSADQQAQVKPILEARRTEMMQLHQDSSMSHDDKMTKMKALDDDSHSKIEAVLNDQQKAKFEKMRDRQEQEHGMHGHGGEEGAPAPQR